MRYLAALAAAGVFTWIVTTVGTTQGPGLGALEVFVGSALIALFAAWRLGR